MLDMMGSRQQRPHRINRINRNNMSRASVHENYRKTAMCDEDERGARSEEIDRRGHVGGGGNKMAAKPKMDG